MTKGNIPSYIVLATGVPSSSKLVLFILLSFFEGWLAALCRPQARGRQCAAMFSFLFDSLPQLLLPTLAFLLVSKLTVSSFLQDDFLSI